MKRRSILIASTVSLAAVGGLCWWMASKPQADSVASPAGIAAIDSLGSLAEDQTLLQQLEKSGQRYAYAATPALSNLSRQTP